MQLGKACVAKPTHLSSLPGAHMVEWSLLSCPLTFKNAVQHSCVQAHTRAHTHVQTNKHGLEFKGGDTSLNSGTVPSNLLSTPFVLREANSPRVPRKKNLLLTAAISLCCQRPFYFRKCLYVYVSFPYTADFFLSFFR